MSDLDAQKIELKRIVHDEDGPCAVISTGWGLLRLHIGESVELELQGFLGWTDPVAEKDETEEAVA